MFGIMKQGEYFGSILHEFSVLPYTVILLNNFLNVMRILKILCNIITWQTSTAKTEIVHKMNSNTSLAV